MEYLQKRKIALLGFDRRAILMLMLLLQLILLPCFANVFIATVATVATVAAAAAVARPCRHVRKTRVALLSRS